MTKPDHSGVPTARRVFSVEGPWSLRSSVAFWEGFAPSALPHQQGEDRLTTAFLAEGDWRRVEVVVTQKGESAELTLSGGGDLDAAAAQVRRFLSIDIDATGWPEVGRRDPVIADAQKRLDGLRPCGFFSPFEAAAWTVLSQRVQMRQAARMRQDIIERYGDDGAFPAPKVILANTFDLPGRKNEYLHAVAEGALEGVLDGSALRHLDPVVALERVQSIKGLGPFAAELVVIRGANAPDVLPVHESRLAAEVVRLYGADRTVEEISESWRPFRSWAAVHLRALATL
ncbi:DNA-3-methyladenine glycosylase [Microbacterium sp.]|uniref:DNA-3-methyladenine glycosylase family protein n=1 Tax=Microbacterium sp. TaxID=51671 RepID=UPI00356736E0